MRLTTEDIHSMMAEIPARLQAVLTDDRNINQLVSVMSDISAVDFAIRSGDATFKSQQIDQFWCQVGAELSKNPDIIGAFVVSSNGFGTFDPDDWGSLCFYRSTTEILRERYPDTFEQGMRPFDWEMLEEMDDEFRKLAPEQEPYSPVAIPDGVPESHWWWYLPRQLREERERAAANDEGPALA